MKDIQQKLLATFQIEHRDHVEQIRSLLAMIQKTGTQPASPELEEVFRRAHSLKGAARAVDIHSIEGLAHRLETLFARVRQGQCTLDESISGVVQQVLDASEECIAGLSEGRTAESVPAALRAIEQVLGMKPAAADSTAPPPQTPVSGFQPIETVRITAENFDGLFRTAGRLVRETQHQDQVAAELTHLAQDLLLIEKESERIRRFATAVLNRSQGSRELVRLTCLLDSMERQLRSVSKQARATRRLQHRSSWSMRQLGNQLQTDVRQARLVPAESLLEGFRKMMRDLARDEGKEIDFQATSAGVGADRRVLEALKDPIMHLLRNAVDHGIESPSERAAKKKSKTGSVSLRIDANGQRLTVTIQDDGRGVDMKRIAEVAVHSGMLSTSDAAERSPQELTRFLFRAGFSTASKVTNLSGRGMGLSVVYETIRRLQGDLDLHPSPGGGTTVLLSVPVSITTHRLVVVTSRDQFFAIPSLGIERLKRIEASSVESVEGKPVVVLNMQPVPLATIHSLLGLEQSLSRINPSRLQIVVLRSGSRRMALLVDAVLRETEAVIQDLGAASGCGGKVSSAVALEDGTIAFVLNPMELIENAARARALLPIPATVKEAPEPASNSKDAARSILVVDDSMTTRTLEKSILEAHGYRVRVAVDGVEALARLREQTADLVIADIEMPRLNGFGLIEAMKQDAALRRIPVIIVSSLERREDRERGLSVGADAYIVKRKFDQEELLAAIRQLV